MNGWSRNSLKPLLLSLLTIVSATTLIAIPTLLNQFPLLFFDSGYYILHGTFQAAPWTFLWRPLTYSVFLGPVVKWSSLLTFSLLQNMIVVTFLWLWSRSLFPEISRRYFLFLTLALTFTPLIVYSNFILPDVFTGLLPLLLGWALIDRERKLAIKGFFLLILSILHHSNLIVMSILTGVGVFFTKTRRLRRILVISTLFLPWVLLPTLHGFSTGNFTISNAAHAIIFSRLMTHGVAQKYLAEVCEITPPYLLCEHRDRNFNIWDWSENGQIGLLGGMQKLTPEFKKINKEILSSPPLVGQLLVSSSQNVFKQLALFSEPLVPSLNSEVLQQEIEFYSKVESRRMSEQTISAAAWESIQSPLQWLHLFLISGSVLSLLYFWYRQWMDSRIKTMLLISIVYYLANAMVCGLLTDPLTRYSGRIIWVFCLLFFIQAFLNWQKPQKHLT